MTTGQAPPENGSFTVRRAQPDEAGALSELALRSKAVWGYDEAFLEACRHELTVSAAEVAGCPTFVATAGDRAVGFYLLRPQSDEVVGLDFLYVDPTALGRGHGSRLLAHARTEAARAGFRRMEIHADPHAERFYRARGAELVGRVPSGSVPGRTLPLLRLAL